MGVFRVLRRWQKRTRALVHTEAVDRELKEEMAYHLELETKKNIALGMTPDEAGRQARVAFGAVEQHRLETREARWWSWFPDLSLDFKLGLRMLVKHPTLTVIATVAVAYAIAVGTVGFEVARQALWPTIPLPDGNAIVALRNWNVADNASVTASRSDYELWRDGLSMITDLSAVETEERSIAVGASAGPETVANVTASTFALTRVPALMGRTLLPADEWANAAEVVVVGYDFWRNKLAGAVDAVGRVVRISGTPVIIVGVMPRGYGFPGRNGIWRPLHPRMPAASPSLRYVFGRLKPGHSREKATVQAATIGARAATMFPETHKNVRLQVLSLPDAVSDLPAAAALVLASLNVFLVLLGALLCGNVAMLLFARAVSRERELLVRAALGASRGRLMVQFFAEALVLSAVGAVVGLTVARWVLSRTWAMIEGQMGPLPFWIDTSVSSTAILYAVSLTLFAAAIAGFVPAFKVTSDRTGARLRAASSGGGGLQFGGVWTVIIVVQIAFTTLLPWPLLGLGGEFGRHTPAGFAAEAFLTATIAMDRLDGVAASGDTVPTARGVRLETRYRALVDRLQQDPGVLDVTYADQMPQLITSNFRAIRMDSGSAALPGEHCAGCNYAKVVSVDPRFFDVVGAPVMGGRGLTTADAEQRTHVVLVNKTFVDQVLGGRNPIGRQFRFASTRGSNAESWYEIVGVVPDLSVGDDGSSYGRRIYQTTLPGETGPLRVAIHTRGDPERFATRLRELAQATDPALRVIDPKPLPFLNDSGSAGMLLYGIELLVSLTLVTLMLSLAGVYAVTAFAVARRTREIGVRVALGARPLDVLTVVFKRPLVQVALGVGVGATLGFGLANDEVSKVHLNVLGNAVVFALSTTLCCALACIVPTRRVLRIQPTEALKDEA